MEVDAGLSNGPSAYSRAATEHVGGGGANTTKQRSFRNLSNLRQERGLLTMLFVLSAVESWAAVLEDPCDEITTSECNPAAVTWAFLAGVVSALVCALLLYLISLRPSAYDLVAEGAGLLLLLWWIAAAYVANFLTPFDELGNGFFASWGALLSAIVFCNSRLDNLLDPFHLLTQPMARSHRPPGSVHPVATSQQPPSIPEVTSSHPSATAATISRPPAAESTSNHPPAAESTISRPHAAESTISRPPAAESTISHPPAAESTISHPPAAESTNSDPPAADSTISDPPAAEVTNSDPPAAASSASSLHSPTPSLPPPPSLFAAAVSDIQQQPRHHLELPAVDHSAHLKTLEPLLTDSDSDT